MICETCLQEYNALKVGQKECISCLIKARAVKGRITHKNGHILAEDLAKKLDPLYRDEFLQIYHGLMIPNVLKRFLCSFYCSKCGIWVEINQLYSTKKNMIMHKECRNPIRVMIRSKDALFFTSRKERFVKLLLENNKIPKL